MTGEISLSNCIFCKIIKKEIPAKIIIENNDAIAFLDISPLSVGHTLIIPKNHFSKFQNMDNKSLQALMEITSKIALSIEKALDADTTIAINNGPKAGQEVMHVHVHVIPRSQGDDAGPVHRLFHKPPSLEDDYIDKISSKIQDNL